jgi:hypothetical protein
MERTFRKHFINQFNVRLRATARITQCIFDNINLGSFGGNAIRFDGSGFSGLQNCEFNSVKIQNNKADCMRLSGYVSAISFTQCTFTDSDYSGISFVGTTNIQSVSFNNCQFEALRTTGSGDAYGVYSDMPSGGIGPQMTFNNCYFEGISKQSGGAMIRLTSPQSLVVNGGIYASAPNAIHVDGNNSNVVIDTPQFIANITGTNSFVYMVGSDSTSKLDIRNVALWYNAAAGFTSSSYVKFSSWNGVKVGIVDGTKLSQGIPLLQTNTQTYKLIQIGVNTAVNASATYDTGLVNGVDYGIMRIHNLTSTNSALYLVSFGSGTVMISCTNAEFTATKGNASTINFYKDTDNKFYIQNNTAGQVQLVPVMTRDSY